MPAMTAQANESIIHHDEGVSIVGEAVVAIVTPFTADGKVDEQALEAYLQVRFTGCRALSLVYMLSLSVFSTGAALAKKQRQEHRCQRVCSGAAFLLCVLPSETSVR